MGRRVHRFFLGGGVFRYQAVIKEKSTELRSSEVGISVLVVKKISALGRKINVRIKYPTPFQELPGSSRKEERKEKKKRKKDLRDQERKKGRNKGGNNQTVELNK